jgi:hypothetical protein
VDAAGERLTEPAAEPTADDHRVDVEHVHGGGQHRARGAHGVVDELIGKTVPLVQGAGDDARGEPGSARLLHQGEERGPVTLLDAVAGAPLHRCPARIGLQASPAAAVAAPASRCRTGVPDLPTGAEPAPADDPVDEERAADPGAVPDGEHVAVGFRRPEAVLTEQRGAHVVVDDDRDPEPGLQLLLKWIACGPAPDVRTAGHGARRGVHLARDSDAECREPAVGGVGQRLLDGGLDGDDHRRRAATPRGGDPGLRNRGEIGAGDDHLDLGRAEVDPGVCWGCGLAAIRHDGHCGRTWAARRAAVMTVAQPWTAPS